jgi:hypothetical protein
MAASAVATEPMNEPALSRRMAMPALEEDEQPAFTAAEPAPARFAPAVHAPAGQPAEESVPGYPHDPQEVQEAASAFAPPDGGRHEVLEPVAIESEGPGEADDVPGAPPTAEMEPPEAATQPAEVSDLEKEMARLLDEISTSRRE